MNLRSGFWVSLILAASGGGACIAMSRAACQLPPGTTAVSSSPHMICGVTIPLFVDSYEIISYGLFSTDEDTVYTTDSRQRTTRTDTHQEVIPVVVRSMSGVFEVGWRGNDYGTVTYSISGMPSSPRGAPTVFLDDWRFVDTNNVPTLADRPVRVQQVVTVKPPPSGVSGQARVAAPAIERQGRAWREQLDRNPAWRDEREVRSAKLRAVLLPPLSAEQREAVERGEEVAVLVSGLPTGARAEAVTYLDFVCQRAVLGKGAPLLDRARLADFSLVFLPRLNAPGGALGVDGYSRSGGRVLF
jgi:hypothetical protein